jgi:hypothetical protein
MIDPSGPAEWSASYAQYLLRTAQQTARTHGLYYLLLQRVSRGELSPATLRDALSAFSGRRGREYGDRFTQLSTRFFDGLADVHRRAVQSYQSDLERVATGGNGSRGTETFADEYTRRTNEQMRAVSRLYFELLDGLTAMTSAAEEEYLRSVLSGTAEETPMVVQLSSPVGASASAVVSLQNTRSERAVIRCMVTDVRRADGVGPAFVPDVVFDPDSLMLDPEQEGSVKLSLTLDAAVYEPGVDYIGAVHIIRHGEQPFDLPLRIRPVAGPSEKMGSTAPHSGDATEPA